MMRLSLLAHPVVRPECHRPSLKPLLSTRARRNMIRCAEGIGLWLAMVLMLFVHPLYAEARAMESEQPGPLYLVDRKSAWQEPALVLEIRFAVQVQRLPASQPLTPNVHKTHRHRGGSR